MKLYLIRHGETEYNQTFRFLGRTDIGLSETGIQQAESLSAQLHAQAIKAIYSSDMVRAKQTADIIAMPHGLEVKRITDLREIDFGAWEGLTYDELVEMDREYFEAWVDDPLCNDIPGGETWEHFRARVIGAIERIIKAEIDGNIAVVSHGGPIRLLASYFKGDEREFFKTFWPSPGSLTIVEVDSSFIR